MRVCLGNWLFNMKVSALNFSFVKLITCNFSQVWITEVLILFCGSFGAAMILSTEQNDTKSLSCRYNFTQFCVAPCCSCIDCVCSYTVVGEGCSTA